MPRKPYVCKSRLPLTATPEDRFWIKVDRRGADECWVWTACKDGCGYGRFRVSGRNVAATHFSWALRHGVSVDGLYVLHSCDNPSCVNPAHLFLGDQQANMDDMVSKGRSYDRRGSRNPRARLTLDDVRSIRALLATESQSSLAKRFGVASNTICAIKTGRIWRDFV